MDNDDLEYLRRIAHISDLKSQAKELAGGEMIEGESPDCPPEVAEQFWEHVVMFEGVPETTYRKLLEKYGFLCPPPDELDEQSLSETLNNLIQVLAQRRIYFERTDHLSDRELYQHFYSELDEPAYDFPPEMETNTHHDILGGCSEEDISLHLKYYADDEERKSWAEDFPDFEMPAKEKLPYDRDRFLPRAEYET